MYNERLFNEVEQLGDLFRKFGREVIFLKGLFFAKRFYGDIAQRAIYDIDILIRTQKDIEIIHRLLRERNYQRISKTLISTKVDRYFTHHYAYHKFDKVVELHWNLQSHFTFKIDTDRIWNHKQKIIYNNTAYYVLSDEYELVAQIISIHTDIQFGTIVLKPLLDAYIILKKIDSRTCWEAFFTRRRAEGLFFISLNTLDLVLSIWDCAGEFTDLATFIRTNGAYLKCNKTDQKLNLFERSGITWRKKLWAMGLYQTSLFGSWCWWGISLPFRLAVY
jgi:hypothetical protein